MNPPVRVLHVFQKLARGGAEIRTLEILRRLGSDRVRADVAVLSGEEGPLDAELSRLGGRPVPMALGPTFPLRFVRHLRRERYDVVHSHVHHVSGLVLALARFAGVDNRVAHFRNTDDGVRGGLVRRIRRVVLKWLIDAHATSILAVGKGAMSAAWRPGWERDPRCQVVYNGLDTSPYATLEGGARTTVLQDLRLPAESRVALHVGRMSPQKNHSRVMSVFIELARRDPSWSLVFAGRRSPDVEVVLRDRIERHDLADRVRILGERNDMPKLLSSADVLLFPSLWEGLPGAVLESAAAGVGVVASDLPGVREIADHFDGVVVLSLEETDGVWADMVERAAAATGPGLRDRNLRAFRSSPFDLDVAAERVLDVWRQRPE